ncbi:MAG: protein phosphatase 2C domain-containing protein [Pseudomonadota bacterium]
MTDKDGLFGFLRGRGAAITWRAAGATNKGLVRQINEDNYLSRSDRGLWLVADGMGGHEAGDVASALIVDRADRAGSPKRLKDAVHAVGGALHAANADLRAMAAERGPNAVIGAATVALVAREDAARCLWAGDARLYRLRGGDFRQISKDHDLVTEMREREAGSALIEAAMAGNVITRAIGAHDGLDLEGVDVDVAPGDVFLLCSDGLYKEVATPMLADRLREPDPNRAAAMLIDNALASGGRDNITAIVVRAEAKKA